jgi:hypothetical protein
MLRTALPLSALGIVMLASSSASAASKEACGNIELIAIGECHFEFSGGCQANCQPLRFVAACDGQCNASIDASCEASCSGECNAQCDVDPGQFDCYGSCNADCTANVGALCGSDQECVSYCEADCDAQCQAECNVVPPSASCEAQCDASCQASCEVDANFECSLDCTAEMQGGCEIACEQPEGALFCDGQYIHIVDFDECMAYLAENFSIEFEASASGEVRADGTFCSIAAPGRTASGLSAGLLALLAGLGIARRRRSS